MITECDNNNGNYCHRIQYMGSIETKYQIIEPLWDRQHIQDTYMHYQVDIRMFATIIKQIIFFDEVTK